MSIFPNQSKKVSLSRVKFPDSMKCLNDADSAKWISNNYRIFENVLMKYLFPFVGVVLTL